MSSQPGSPGSVRAGDTRHSPGDRRDTPPRHCPECSRLDSREHSAGRNRETPPRTWRSPCPRAPHRTGRTGGRRSSGWSCGGRTRGHISPHTRLQRTSRSRPHRPGTPRPRRSDSDGDSQHRARPGPGWPGDTGRHTARSPGPGTARACTRNTAGWPGRSTGCRSGGRADTPPGGRRRWRGDRRTHTARNVSDCDTAGSQTARGPSRLRHTEGGSQTAGWCLSPCCPR